MNLVAPGCVLLHATRKTKRSIIVGRADGYHRRPTFELFTGTITVAVGMKILIFIHIVIRTKEVVLYNYNSLSKVSRLLSKML